MYNQLHLAVVSSYAHDMGQVCQQRRYGSFRDEDPPPNEATKITAVDFYLSCCRDQTHEQQVIIPLLASLC